MTSNVTLTAEEPLLLEARRKASSQDTSLNELFRGWLLEYVSDPTSRTSYQSLMDQLGYAVAGRRFSRDELNARS
jgi:hypothetical protein